MKTTYWFNMLVALSGGPTANLNNLTHSILHYLFDKNYLVDICPACGGEVWSYQLESSTIRTVNNEHVISDWIHVHIECMDKECGWRDCYLEDTNRLCYCIQCNPLNSSNDDLKQMFKDLLTLTEAELETQALKTRPPDSWSGCFRDSNIFRR